ncbi:BTE_collapsed_G0004140.mRNA.1.CDS.1 [Saccharomyces cerevisiae]|nr:BTE_collapsed_G0004140.mRNA.1.CDS.1 [Saccharomyces cerevisiae]
MTSTLTPISERVRIKGWLEESFQQTLQFLLAGREVDEDLELSKSNVLVVGPSGSGKTLLATILS